MIFSLYLLIALRGPLLWPVSSKHLSPGEHSSDLELILSSQVGCQR